MPKPVVVTARIDEQLSADLDALAALRHRSRAWIVEQAIASYLADELELHASLAEAERDIDEGRCLSHEEFMSQLKAEYAARRAA